MAPCAQFSPEVLLPVVIGGLCKKGKLDLCIELGIVCTEGLGGCSTSWEAGFVILRRWGALDVTVIGLFE